jgi:hypothetical protein
VPIDMFLADVERRKPVRVKGTAVFMTSEADGAPVVLLHHLEAQQGVYTTRWYSCRFRRPKSRGATGRADPRSTRSVRASSACRRRTDSWRRRTCRRSCSTAAERDQREEDRCVVLPRSRATPRQPASPVEGPRDRQHGALAEEAVRADVSERARGNGVLRDPAESRRRAGTQIEF